VTDGSYALAVSLEVAEHLPEAAAHGFVTGRWSGGDATVTFPQVALAFGLSAVAGFLAIAFLSYWVRRSGFLPFVLYRVALGVYLLYVFYVAGGPAC